MTDYKGDEDPERSPTGVTTTNDNHDAADRSRRGVTMARSKSFFQRSSPLAADTAEDAADHDVTLTPFVLLRYGLSIGLLVFSCVLVGALIFTGNTRIAQETNSWVALLVCILAVLWLSMIEGQQASLVGLPPVDADLYQESHPLTYKNAALAFRGDNLNRYLMGRQFMVLMIVFTINQAAGPLNPAGDVLGMPAGVKFVFLDIGLGMVIFTCILGQLTTQVISSHCMLDYINNYFALFTLYVCMFVEFSGIMHCSYLIQNLLAAVSGKPIISHEPPRTGVTFAFFWTRVVMSLAILSFCMAVTLVALFNGQTMVAVKYPAIPNGVNVALFFLCMSIVGMLEGMQIAFFAVAKLPDSERGTSFFGRKTCELLFRGNGQNLPGFMIGRQLTVVFSFFLVGSITGLDIAPGQDPSENIFGISDSAQVFLNYGFHGAVITTILASITWQLAASAFPIAFLNNPVTYLLLLVALFLEFTGLCSGARVCARLLKAAAGYQYDEVYLGTPEWRIAKGRGDGPTIDTGREGGGWHGQTADALDSPTGSEEPALAAVPEETA